MLRYLPLFLVLGLLIYCVIDVLTTDRRRFRSPGKGAWVLIALIPFVGALLWLTLGRPRRLDLQAPPPRRRGRVVAPDDDPEFLRELDRKAWRARREAGRGSAAPPPASEPPASEPEGPEDLPGPREP